VNEGWVPGGDPGPESSPPQVAFSRADAIQRLGGRSIRRRRYISSIGWRNSLANINLIISAKSIDRLDKI